MASRKDPYEYRTIITGGWPNTGKRKLRKLLREGWAVTVTERHGYSMNRVTLQRENPRYRGEVAR